MGVHAVGRLNVQFSGNAYSWVRGAKLFNNKYYKLLAGVPDRVFESCTGTLDDKVVQTNVPIQKSICIISLLLDRLLLSPTSTLILGRRKRSGDQRYDVDQLFEIFE